LSSVVLERDLPLLNRKVLCEIGACFYLQPLLPSVGCLVSLQRDFRSLSNKLARKFLMYAQAFKLLLTEVKALRKPACKQRRRKLWRDGRT
jgi:hypothetical protein